MTNYVCERCGAHLDPGEHCECLEEKKERIDEIMALLIVTDSGQMQLNFGR